MPFITFFYKVNSDEKMYYGKYATDYISDDHCGLDKEVRYVLKEALKKTITEKITSLTVGVLSYSESGRIPLYSSQKEIDAFDFYYTYDTKSGGSSYVKGVRVA